VGRSRFHRSRAEAGVVRVGWAGVLSTHRGDLHWLRPQARRALRGALFTTVGDHRTAAELGADRAEVFPWQKAPPELYRLMARADVGIVPLDPAEPFNRAKSWLKALEYVSMGIPVVATDLPEQRMLLGETGAGFVVATPEEFADAVQVLVRNSDLRAHMASQARALGEHLALERQAEVWREPLTALVPA
jgi:glycosyltransferase involved in cell wall biosynthesis